MRFRLRNPVAQDQAQRENNEGIYQDLNELAQFVFWGSGAPAFTPSGRALYIRVDGGAATTLYVWEGAAWAGK